MAVEHKAILRLVVSISRNEYDCVAITRVHKFRRKHDIS